MIRFAPKVTVVSPCDSTVLFLDFFLSEKNFQVDFCNDLQMFTRSSHWDLPDLFIFDHHKNESCANLCEKFQHSPRRSTVPILVLMNRESKENRHQLLDAGASDVLEKPFSAEHLSIHINSLLFPSADFCAAELSSLVYPQQYLH